MIYPLMAVWGGNNAASQQDHDAHYYIAVPYPKSGPQLRGEIENSAGPPQNALPISLPTTTVVPYPISVDSV